ncbi:MAG TPA: radical SAM protein [Syntrophorhabdaceae bacterium]|nr:radical SAM protein [Syntrophorhabdaceae bacterium]
MKDNMDLLRSCTICPRQCKVNRLEGSVGFCHIAGKIIIAHAGPHYGEEPPISGTSGSGTVFFSFCNLRCLFCQNYQISQEGQGDEISTDTLADTFIALQDKGCHNINLVSPTPYIPHIITALKTAKKNGLSIPVVYNTNAYESPRALKMLEGLIDIFLPDFKYWNDAIAEKLSGIPKEKPYAKHAKGAILEMKRQVGDLKIVNGLAQKGLLIRHLVLPGGLAGTADVFRWVAEHLGTETQISLMSQYYPAYKAQTFPILRRKIRQEEYDAATNCLFDLGFRNVFVQILESSELFVPDFEEQEPFEARCKEQGSEG